MMLPDVFTDHSTETSPTMLTLFTASATSVSNFFDGQHHPSIISSLLVVTLNLHRPALSSLLTATLRRPALSYLPTATRL